MSAAADNGAGAAALSFWRWLNQVDRYRRPASLVGMTLPFAMLVATTGLSTMALSRLFPLDGLEEEAMHGRSAIRAAVAIMGGCLAWVMMFMVMPDSRRDAMRICLLALLAGVVCQAGMVAGLVILENSDLKSGVGRWVPLPLLAISVFASMAIMYATAYRYRMPAPAAPRGLRDILEVIPTLCLSLPLGAAAACAFGLVHGWTAPADCGPPLGAGILGFLASFISGLILLPAWRRAGALRWSLLRQWGLGMLIVLAAVPLGHLFDCTPVTTLTLPGSDRLDHNAVLGLFGGYALLVYVAAGLLAAWQMDRFLARNRLRAQDLAEKKATP